MIRRPLFSRNILLGLLCLTGGLVALGARPKPDGVLLSLALPRSVETIFGNPSQEVLVTCTGIIRVSSIGTVRTTGLPFVRNTIELDAARVKLFAQVSTFGPSLFGPSCDSHYAAVNPGGFRWTLVSRPEGSTAAVDEGNSLTANLRLDTPGSYTVRFVACENESCSMSVNDQTLVPQADSAEFTIEAVTDFAIPPEIHPPEPNTEPTQPTLIDPDDLCGRWPDHTAPAWQTVEEWRDAGDYKLLEGRVRESRSTSADNWLNHRGLDWLFFVQPDPQYRNLLPRGIAVQDRIEVEWEEPEFAAVARPTAGDRASVIGYWINDCGHGGKTEIHPPVMVASHKPRPILLPESLGMGTNVYVGGISSTVYVNRDAGEVTDNCSRTALHDARSASNGCLPISRGFEDGRNPVDRLFEYHILLPRNPADVLAELGFEAPRANLHTDVFRPLGGGGPEPVLEQTTVGGVDAIRVQIDLRRFTGATYARRIEAAWIYPSPENWGLQNWRVRLDSMEVHDDVDADIDLLVGDIDNDGDWHMWVNLPNGFFEWIQIFDCSGCIQEGTERFDGRPWETGSLGGTRSLGPDVLLFPGQLLWMHTSGFESDSPKPDPLGNVNLFLDESERTRRTARSDRDVYTLFFEVSPGRPVGDPNLTLPGRLTHEQYVIRADPDRPTIPGLENRPFEVAHPVNLQLLPGSPPFNAADSGFATEAEAEPLSITDITLAELERRLAESRENEPEALDAAFRELREEVDVLLRTPESVDVMHALQTMEAGLPGDVWTQYFGDIDVGGLGPPRNVLVPWWWLVLTLFLGMAAVLLSHRPRASL